MRDASGPWKGAPIVTKRLRGDDVSRAVFADLPARYDQLAYLLSFGQDRRWRGAVVDPVVAARPKRVLDVATGPAGIALAGPPRARARGGRGGLKQPLLPARAADGPPAPAGAANPPPPP